MTVARHSCLSFAALALLCCQGTIGDGEVIDPEGSEATLQAPVLPRLTTAQYWNSVHDLLGPDLPEMPLEPDSNPYLFYSIGATSTELSELGVQQLEEAADALSKVVFDDAQRRSDLVGCTPTAPDDSCATDFITTFGRRAFRRPLNEQELTLWQNVSTDLSDGDGWLGLRYVVSGMLQAPSFVYRVELGEPDPDDTTRQRYTAWEMASRLAFTFWNSGPDDELLDAAASGELLTAAGVEAQARRMLQSDRTSETVQEFFAQYFDLSRLDDLDRDPATYPQFTDTMAESMRTEVKLLVDDLVNRRNTDVRQIFSTRRTFVNSDLAALYDVDAPGASAVAFTPVELPADGPRAGLLTLGAFLAMNAHESDTSPTLRGKYLRERVLCQTVPAPPDDIDIDLTPDPSEPKTLRERLDQHRDDPACSSCHSFIDPPGFLFEGFDSAGAFRTADSNGYPVDTSGDLDAEPLADARALAEVLQDHERVSACMVTQLFRHAQSRLDDSGEGPAIEQLDASFAASGYRFRELLVALVTHDSFRFVAPIEVTP